MTLATVRDKREREDEAPIAPLSCLKSENGGSKIDLSGIHENGFYETRSVSREICVVTLPKDPQCLAE